MQALHVSLRSEASSSIIFFQCQNALSKYVLLSFVNVELHQQPNFVRSRAWNMHFAAIALHLDCKSSRWRVIKRNFVHLEIRIHKTEQKMRRKM